MSTTPASEPISSAAVSRRVWIARHAERQNFVDPFWYEKCQPPGDQYDSPLSQNGLIQARDLAQRLSTERIDHIFASPFYRTLQTADAIAAVLDLPIKIEHGIGESLMPNWFPANPMKWSLADRKRQFPRVDDSHQSVVQPEYPEDWDATRLRSARTLALLVEKYEGNFVCIGHGATVSSMTWDLLPDYPKMGPGLCTLNRIDCRGDQWCIGSQGERDFLTYHEPEFRLQ